MKVHKIADLDLSQHPLYSLMRTEAGPSLVSGGLDNHLFRLGLETLENIRELNPLSTQKPLFDKIPGLKTSVYTLLEDPDHKTIWLGGGAGILQNLNPETSEFRDDISLGKSPIFSLNIHKNQIWIGLGNGDLKILDPDLRTFKISEEAIRVIEFNHDHKIVALAGKDSLIRILEVDTLKILYTLRGHTFPVFSLGFSPDGKYLLSGSRDASIKIWETENYTLIDTIPAHLFAINHILFHPEQPYFFTASMDKSIKVWGSDDFKLYKIINAEKTGGHISSVNRMAWTGLNKPSLVSVSDDRRIILWDIEF